MESMQEEDESKIETDIRREFQLERMILFSDAVFAIVITLMAIEIHLPETGHKLSNDELMKAFYHLIPTILAYVVSFFFIGTLWYQHLKIFHLLKDYTKNLVVINLLLLFFVGLFPFASTVVTKGIRNGALPFLVYFSIIICCIVTQTILQHYILIKRPDIRHKQNIDELLKELSRKKLIAVMMPVIFILIIISNHFITDPNLKPMSMYWIFLVPIIMLVKKRKDRLKKFNTAV